MPPHMHVNIFNSHLQFEPSKLSPGTNYRPVCSSLSQSVRTLSRVSDLNKKTKRFEIYSHNHVDQSTSTIVIRVNWKIKESSVLTFDCVDLRPLRHHVFVLHPFLAHFVESNLKFLFCTPIKPWLPSQSQAVMGRVD